MLRQTGGEQRFPGDRAHRQQTESLLRCRCRCGIGKLRKPRRERVLRADDHRHAAVRIAEGIAGVEQRGHREIAAADPQMQAICTLPQTAASARTEGGDRGSGSSPGEQHGQREVSVLHGVLRIESGGLHPAQEQIDCTGKEQTQQIEEACLPDEPPHPVIAERRKGHQQGKHGTPEHTDRQRQRRQQHCQRPDCPEQPAERQTEPPQRCARELPAGAEQRVIRPEIREQQHIQIDCHTHHRNQYSMDAPRKMSASVRGLRCKRCISDILCKFLQKALDFS